MADSVYGPYVFNPSAEVPKFRKGDPPAHRDTKDLRLSTILQDIAQNEEECSQHENSELGQSPLQEWMQRTSPSGITWRQRYENYLT